MQIGFSGLLFLIFLVLKLVGTISWSWWWVTSPIWISLIFVFVVAIAVQAVPARFRKSTGRQW